MLTIEQINVFYGAIHALKGVSLQVNEGEIVTLIGANGAGKSTLLKAISGLIKVRDGSILYYGRPLMNQQAQQIVKAGISHVPEGRRIFANMSVEENLELGGFLRKNKAELKKDMAMVYDRFPRLAERRNQLAGTLSGGEQQMLAIGRALMAKPKLLILDEPSMGLAPLLVRSIFQIIEEIRELGVTILLVEQNANIALSIADRAYIIETGKVVLTGTPAELEQSGEVKKAYLGG